MNDLRTQLRDTGWRRRRRTLPTRLIDVTFAAVFALIATAVAMHDPPRAPDVTIDNETPYDLTIKVSDEAGKDWMAFALVNAGSQTIVRAPIDQGAVWTFSYGAGGEYRSTDPLCERPAGEFACPPACPQRLAAAGIAPSPQRNQP